MPRPVTIRSGTLRLLLHRCRQSPAAVTIPVMQNRVEFGPSHFLQSDERTRRCRRLLHRIRRAGHRFGPRTPLPSAPQPRCDYMCCHPGALNQKRRKVSAAFWRNSRIYLVRESRSRSCVLLGLCLLSRIFCLRIAKQFVFTDAVHAHVKGK